VILISVIVILTSLGQEPLTGINDFTKMKKVEREEKKKAIKIMSFVHQSYNEDLRLDRVYKYIYHCGLLSLVFSCNTNDKQNVQTQSLVPIVRTKEVKHITSLVLLHLCAYTCNAIEEPGCCPVREAQDTSQFLHIHKSSGGVDFTASFLGCIYDLDLQ